jgi:hypothetical protein
MLQAEGWLILPRFGVALLNTPCAFKAAICGHNQNGRILQDRVAYCADQRAGPVFWPSVLAQCSAKGNAP